MGHQKYQSCIEACVRCAAECESCADACLDEKDVKALAACIRLDRDCATICRAAAGLMSRGSQFADDLCRVCAEVCEACEAECQKHAAMAHCKRCAEACKRCAAECSKMAGVPA